MSFMFLFVFPAQICALPYIMSIRMYEITHFVFVNQSTTIVALLGIILLLILALLYYVNQFGFHSKDKFINSLLIAINANDLSIWMYDIKKDRFKTLHNNEYIPNGYTLDKYTNNIAKKNKDEFYEAIQRLITGKSQFENVCFKFINPENGHIFYLKDYMSVINDGHENNLILGTHNNITEQVLFKQEANNANMRFQKIFSSSAIAMFLYNKDGMLIDINDKAVEQFHIIDKQKALNPKSHFSDRLHFKKNLTINEIYAKEVSKYVDYDFSQTNDDNLAGEGKRRLIIKYGPIYGDQNELLGILMSCIDITDEIERNKHYEQLYAKSQTIKRHLPVGLITYDQKGEATSINQMAAKIHNINDTEKWLEQRHSLFDCPLFYDVMNDDILRKGQYESEIVLDLDSPIWRKRYGITDSECGKKNIWLNFQTIKDNSNELVGYAVIVMDRTDKVEDINQINDMHAKLELALSAGKLTAWTYDFDKKEVEFVNKKKDEHVNNELVTYMINKYAGDIDNIIKSLLNGNIKRGNIMMRHKEASLPGGYRYYDCNIIARRVNGVIVGLAGTHRDVTHNQLHNIEIEEKRKKIELAIKAGDITQWDFDVESRMFATINDKLLRDANNITINEWEQTIYEEDLARCRSIIKKMESGVNESSALDLRQYNKDNGILQYVTIGYTPLEKDETGKVTKYTGYKSNNTKWIQLNQKLEHISNDALVANKLLGAILDSLPCALYIKDADDDFRYIIVSDLFCNKIGLTAEKIIGHTDFNLFEENEASKFRQDDITAIKNGSITFEETTNWKGIRTVWQTIKHILIAPGRRRLLIGLGLDITENDITMHELQKAKEKAEQSDVLKSVFLSNMSHEIRTPLNAITGFAYLLTKTNDDKEKQQFSNIINTNTELLLNLINNILDLSKIEAGYIDSSKEMFDVADYFNELVLSFSIKMKAGVELIYNPPYQSCRLYTYKKRIAQIMNNYISNAIKYTVQGSIAIGYEHIDDKLLLQVYDTGIGISEKNYERVFKRFEKFDSFAQGNGLGLSICKAIAESLGGSVGFESKEGVGSYFWACIPVDATTDKQESTDIANNINVERPLAENETQTGKKAEDKENANSEEHNNILVVEDNDDNYKLIEALLRDYPIRRAVNGKEAVEMVKKGNYSAVFMDMTMPVMGGIEATKTIRGFDKETPIIAITANTYESDIKKAKEAGCNGFLKKPLSKKELMEILDDILHK